VNCEEKVGEKNEEKRKKESINPFVPAVDIFEM
jgi:hypothetical protein